MVIFEKHERSAYYKIDLLFPIFTCNSLQVNELSSYRLTKFDLSTKFILKEYDNRVMIEMRLLGFGLNIYLSWRQ